MERILSGDSNEMERYERAGVLDETVWTTYENSVSIALRIYEGLTLSIVFSRFFFVGRGW